jgi:hypothetical protein
MLRKGHQSEAGARPGAEAEVAGAGDPEEAGTAVMGLRRLPCRPQPGTLKLCLREQQGQIHELLVASVEHVMLLMVLKKRAGWRGRSSTHQQQATTRTAMQRWGKGGHPFAVVASLRSLKQIMLQVGEAEHPEEGQARGSHLKTGHCWLSGVQQQTRSRGLRLAMQQEPQVAFHHHQMEMLVQWQLTPQVHSRPLQHMQPRLVQNPMHYSASLGLSQLLAAPMQGHRRVIHSRGQMLEA